MTRAPRFNSPFHYRLDWQVAVRAHDCAYNCVFVRARVCVDARTNHRTSKPVKFTEFLLKYSSKEDQTILDPSAGSGSTCVACTIVNRKCVLIEKDEKL